MFPNPPFSSGSPERVRSSTGHGWTRGSPPSFLSSKAGGRAFPVLTLPVPRPACLQGGALGPSHSVMQTARPCSQAAHCVLSQNPENQALARFYCHTEKTIAKRLVLRQDPSVKRTLCRSCSSLLIPGLTCTQRQRRRKGQRWTVQTCLTCQRSQRFLNDPKHLLWGDRPEAQLENQADINPSEPLPNIADLPKENIQTQALNTSE